VGRRGANFELTGIVIIFAAIADIVIKSQ